MSPNRQKFLTIGLVLLEAITVTIPVIILGDAFQFPDILRQPASVALALFRQNEAVIVPAYYVFMVSGLLYLPLSYTLRQSLSDSVNSNRLRLLVGLGLATALFQAIGFSRWLFTIPYLAGQYAAHPAQRDGIALLYETLNRYAGMTIGEHLGFLAMGAWQLTLSSVLWGRAGWGRWLGGLGFVLGAMLILSVGEHFGGPQAAFYGTLNFLANAVWTFWMLALALYLFKKQA